MIYSWAKKHWAKAGKSIEIRNKKRMILIILTGIIAVLILSAVFFLFLKEKNYHDNDSYREYAESHFEELSERPALIDANQPQVETEIVNQYGTPCSTSVEYPIMKDKQLEARMRNTVDKQVEILKQRKETLAAGDKIAVFARSRAYSTPKEAVGLVVYLNKQKSEGSEMVDVDSTVYTCNYSTETGLPLSTNQIFKSDYPKFCSKYLLAYFQEKEAGDLVKSNYKKSLSSQKRNFNKFALTNTSVRFYFEAGAVLNKERGEVTVDLSYNLLKEVLRDPIISRSIDPKKPMIALTYDDGPAPPYSNQILDCFEKHNSVATFFELGKNVKSYPEIIKRQAELGMETGSHSWSHPNLHETDSEETKSQIVSTRKEIQKACGKAPTVFRPPYGNFNKAVQKYAKAPIVLWSIDTLDWKSKDPNRIVRIVKEHGRLDGSVILMHSNYDATAKATEILVPWLLEEGFQLVTVSELIEYKYNETPKNGKAYQYQFFNE